MASEFSYQFLAGTPNFAVVLIDNDGVLNRVQEEIFESDPSNITLANLHVFTRRKCYFLTLDLFSKLRNRGFDVLM